MNTQHRPTLAGNEAESIAAGHFGIEASATELHSDRDQNFGLSSNDGSRYVLKISNPMAAIERLRFENDLMRRVEPAVQPVLTPTPIYGTGGEDVVVLKAKDGQRYFARLLRWVDGKQLAYFRPHTPELFEAIGSCLGRFATAARSTGEVGTTTSPEWDLRVASETIRSHVHFVTDPARRTLIEEFLISFADRAAPRLDALPQQVVHNDANDHNILVSIDHRRSPTLRGLIDFGDAATGYRIGDVAIAAAYGMFGKDDPLAAATSIAGGFATQCEIDELEAELLFDLICMRLCTSVVLSARRSRSEPDNEYATISEKPAWALLSRLANTHPDLARYRVRRACGFEVNPGSSTVSSWLQTNADAIAPICDVDFQTAKLTVFDLSPGSPDPVVLEEEPTATRMLFERLRAEDSAAGIGRYNEARLVYNGPQFETEAWEGKRFRTVHLGIDVFLPEGEPVYAPLDGEAKIVHDEDKPQSYGPVVVVKHTPSDCPTFYTLYGHLGRACLEQIRPGQRVAAGEVIGQIGGPEENGGWTPHLHFQIVTDLLGNETGFPGVAPADQREIWCGICPDPNVVLRIPPGLLEDRHLSRSEILSARARELSPSLSLSYDEPLHIVRGIGTRLYDAEGRAYLDCVNNVNHVGHGRPEVNKAAADQMRVLNTNTRYLHENIVRYAERLTATLPEPLDTCFFVNSGSEANDLAIRLARQYTGRESLAVVGGAYHGHLSSLIRLSPYKFDGPGGSGKPPGVYVAPMPDVYRGQHRGEDAAAAYAGDAERCFEAATADGGVAAFLFESMLSCGGQIDPPEGYLRAACEAARRVGGLCIADEVQVGFGRVGETFWAFERHGIVPDIVTMGKPIGNGHPLAAVVTTRAIAEAFANGMEYFNTYGGNPVSCAVGLAVLEIVERDRLQEHALRVGSRLQDLLRDLALKHPIVGDVRGSGLFLGIELVNDRDSKSPAPLHAAYLVNRARRFGVLLSTDGPERNVIKIKPPLVFNDSDADELVGIVDSILSEDPCKG